MALRVKDITIPLLLWNPVTLTLLTKSVSVAIIISFSVVIAWYMVAARESMRLKVWMFNLCAIGSIMYHGELLFRSLATGQNIPNLYELHGDFYFNKPLLNQKFSNDEYISHYKTNCQGYRIDNLSNPNDSIKQCDWLFIGDSFTQGAQVEYKDLFSSKVYYDFPDKVIVNAGISGAGLYDELAYYKNMGSKLKPKVVFLQIGVFNDFLNVQKNHANYQDYLKEWSSLYRFLSYHLFHTEHLPLSRWTEPIFPDIEDNINANILYKETSAVKEQDKIAFKQCLEEWKETVENNGGRLVLLLIPSKEQISDKMLTEVLTAYNLDKEMFDMTYPNRFCEDIANTLNIQLLDLYGDFRASDAFPFFMRDEHMNIRGHELIANRICKAFAKESNKYEYISQSNRNERYPTLYADGENLLFQTQIEDYYQIASKPINSTSLEILWSSVQELVHPCMSSDLRYMAFTEGNQSRSQTNVILYDRFLQKSVQVNDNNTFASIPTFNENGTRLVYAVWSKEEITPYIAVYDINAQKNIIQFVDGVECWRPIFLSDEQILYISKKNRDSNFIVKCYDTRTNTKTNVLSTEYNIWDIAVPPSKKEIAFAGNKDNNWDLFKYDMHSQQITQLTKTLGNEWDPSYGDNNNTLWFAGTFGVNNGIYKINLR